VYHDGSWGTVCDDGFTDASARVVCNMIGYGYVADALTNSPFSFRDWSVNTALCNYVTVHFHSYAHLVWD